MTISQDLNLQKNVERENLMRGIINRIRLSLELQEILTTTVAEVRSFLGTDRVMIYKFHADESGQVIAESLDDNHPLPSLLGLNFPADDIPSQARELFVRLRVRSVVDVSNQQISQTPASVTTKQTSSQIPGRPVDPCHVEYLTAMGVKSSLVAPILHEQKLWGLLVSHHSQPRQVTTDEIEAVQMVVDQLSIAIAHSTLLSQTREKAEREAIVNRVALLLHSLPTIALQPALEATVAAFGGCGGRLCIRNEIANIENGKTRSLAECLIPGNDCLKLYTCGQQPILPQAGIYPLIEQYNVWQEHYKSGEFDVWAISDIYQTPGWQSLEFAFQATKIRGILIIPLSYRQQLVGYLSIFRDEADIETLWAGEFDPDERQNYPRKSFAAWRQLKQGQAQPWTAQEIELAAELGKQFASAVQQYELYQQVQALNNDLEKQVKRRMRQLQQVTEQQQAVFGVVAKFRQSLDTNTIIKTTTQEVCQLLRAERVSIYRFDADWGGEFVGDFEITSPSWSGMSKLGVNVVWNDTYLQDTEGGRYRHNETFAVNDIYKMGFTQCHIDNLEVYEIRAFVLAPIFVGEKLWGLLAVYQHSGPREWKDYEVNFITQIAAQLGVALQQAELLTQMQQQAANLRQVAQQQQILFEVVAKMRGSLDLETIFAATVSEVRRSLKADRVAIYRFDPTSEYEDGEIISEDVVPEFISAKQLSVKDNCFKKKYAALYQQGSVHAIADIHNANLNPCYVQMLDRLQIQANLVVPLAKADKLWGLLCIHQCSHTRQWQLSEIQFVSQVAAQLGVALEQADLLNQTKQQAEQLAQTLKNLKQMQTQLIQSEKMSSLGQLVAGVAHEINNPVNFIHGNIAHISEYIEDLLEMLTLYQQFCPNPSPEILERAQEIDLDFIIEDLPKILSSMQIGTERIRQIVLSLRNFSRLDQAEKKPVNIHEGIDSTLLILQHRLKAKFDSSGIEVIKEYGDLPLVECYAGQMNQVFMNVLSNALDALEQHKQSQGKDYCAQIKIKTTVGQLEGNIPSVVIRIADNGPGIPEDLIARIFEPFFTTKPVGQGTGLGLSISYQIVVDKHGGVFKCESSPGLGTEFWIEIPMTQP